VRRAKQAGYIMRHRGWWVLRYRERVGVGGEVKTVQRAKSVLCEWMGSTKQKPAFEILLNAN
jgi:hypothetical protein